MKCKRSGYTCTARGCDKWPCPKVEKPFNGTNCPRCGARTQVDHTLTSCTRCNWSQYDFPKARGRKVKP